MKKSTYGRIVLDQRILEAYPDDFQEELVKTIQEEIDSSRHRAIEDAMKSDEKRADFAKDPPKYLKSLGIDPEPIRRIGILSDSMPWDPRRPCPPGYHKEFVAELHVETGHHTIVVDRDTVIVAPHIKDKYISIAVYCVKDDPALFEAPPRLDSSDIAEIE